MPANDGNSMTNDAPRRSGGFWFWLVLAALAVALLANSLLRPPGASQNAQALGKPLARLELEPLTGSGQAAGERALQGRVTVLNFWGTWCPPCQEELPHVVALREKFRRDRRFQLFAVSCPAGDDSDLSALHEETAEFLRRRHFELPTYFDPGETTRLAVQSLLRTPFFSYPTTLVLDEGGIVRGAWTGYRAGDEREVEALVTKLLSARRERAGGRQQP